MKFNLNRMANNLNWILLLLLVVSIGYIVHLHNQPNANPEKIQRLEHKVDSLEQVEYRLKQESDTLQLKFLEAKQAADSLRDVRINLTQNYEQADKNIDTTSYSDDRAYVKSYIAVFLGERSKSNAQDNQ